MYRLSVFLAAAALTGCVTTQVQPTLKGQAIHGKVFVVAGKMVPLPEGAWVVVGEERRSTNGGSEIAAFALADVGDINRRAKGMIDVRLNTTPGRYSGWNAQAQCERTDTFVHIKNANYQGSDQNCVLLNHMSLSSNSRTPQYIRDAIDALKKSGTPIPGNSVYSYHHMADRSDFLTVLYHFNPDSDGIAPTKNSGWPESDWHPIRVDQFPQKKAYLEKMKVWATNNHVLFEKGFTGDLPLTSGSEK